MATDMALRSDDECAQRSRYARCGSQYAGALLVLSTAWLMLAPYYARAQYSNPFSSTQFPNTQFPTIPSREPGNQLETRRGWEFHPMLAVEETYTDNVRLRPEGQERSDWVTSVRPGFMLRNNGPRLRASLTYAPQLIYRKNEETHDVFNYLTGYATTEVVNDLLFFDAQGYVSRQNTTLFGPQAESDVNRTGNRTSVHAYSLSPYLRRNFGAQSRGELRYSHSIVQYGTSSLFSSEADRVDARLASGPAYRRLTWDVTYYKDHIRYTETHQSVDMQRINAGVNHLITPTLGILANAGYEENDYVTVGPAPKGKSWSVGPSWTPTPRTRLVATTGRRFFGPTHSIDFSHRTRLTAWTVKYDEDLTTGRGQVFIPTTFDTASYLDTLLLPRIPEPAARQAAVQSLIAQSGLPSSLSAPVNYVTTTPFVQKRLIATFAINGVRNTVVLHGYHQTRDVSSADAVAGQPGAGDLALSPCTVQAGAGALWSLRISQLTTSNLSVDVSRNEFPAINREDTVTAVRLALVKQFQPRVSGMVAYRRLQNHSNQSQSSYRENAVVVGLQLTF